SPPPKAARRLQSCAGRSWRNRTWVVGSSGVEWLEAPRGPWDDAAHGRVTRAKRARQGQIGCRPGSRVASGERFSTIASLATRLRPKADLLAGQDPGERMASTRPSDATRRRR